MGSVMVLDKNGVPIYTGKRARCTRTKKNGLRCLAYSLDLIHPPVCYMHASEEERRENNRALDMVPMRDDG